MIESFQQQCEQIYSENQEIIKELNKLKQSALEKNQEILKLQHMFKEVEQDYQPIHDKIKSIKDQFQDSELNKQALCDSLDDLENLIMRQFAEQIKVSKKSKKTQKKESPSKGKISNENDQNTINLRKRTIKLQNYDDNSQTNESSEPIKASKKKVKTNTEALDKANCLINEIFNFN
ncbi:unnamed protein product (macronuclear) [Paramecium tetraurelia]|uniref:Uncharacterized protein n=1 Tax=Paramecium tetraurelia TaxID=5888 RepID=A0C5Q5_PARTE|nr:uncharacterized protein GSPATT00035251001 [Paramecium tetraurelia]CAK66122.1 unnamed protein product [Paramecium tetraurelia]|eukprot:XP_001433519.1 hypothetical protein (macronuclear) [Paramecium tetraurelia strain d4-2]